MLSKPDVYHSRSGLGNMQPVWKFSIYGLHQNFHYPNLCRTQHCIETKLHDKQIHRQ